MMNLENNKEKDIHLSNPIDTYCKEVQTLFELDDDIEVGDRYHSEDPNYTYERDIIFHNVAKYTAAKLLLKKVIVMGNLKLKENFVLEDTGDYTPEDYKQAVETLFAGNPYFEKVVTVKDSGTLSPIAGVYSLFARKVVSFFNDDISEYYGRWNGLPENLARDIFNRKAKRNVRISTLPEEEE